MKEKYLIYGATGAVGAATARRLKNNNMDVHLAGRSENKLAELAEELQTTYTVADVNEPACFQQAAADAGEELAGLVYAIGTINLKRFERLTDDDYLVDFRVNAMGAAAAVQASLPSLRNHDSKASVVLYSSVAATTGFGMHASISMAKAAVNGLTIALAGELSPRIRVNAIAPSLLKTPLTEKLLANPKVQESLASAHPLQRLGTAEDVAAATVFLLSNDSSWMTGQILGLDGGRSVIPGAT